MRARGVRPYRRTASSEAISSSAGADRDLRGHSAAVSSRRRAASSATPSSPATCRGGPLVLGHARDRRDLPARTRPDSIAANARRWLSSANSSMSPRLKPHFSHMSSAPRNWEISWSPYRSFQLRRTGTAMPFSSAMATLEPIGTMLMFSTPEATTRSWVPESTRLRGEVDRLLRRAALAVDGDAGHALGQPRRQPRRTRDVEGLRADLADAAHDHVVDRLGVDPGTLRSSSARARRGRPDAPPPAHPSPADRGTDRPDDVRLGHDASGAIPWTLSRNADAPRRDRRRGRTAG